MSEAREALGVASAGWSCSASVPGVWAPGFALDDPDDLAAVV
jgi:hypothetical protein